MVRRLKAILVADIVGFSNLMQADEEGALARVKHVARVVLDPLIAQHDGSIFKTTGDGLLAAFDSTVDAVRCAVAIQTGVKAHTSGAHALTYRIGVNVGDVLSEGDDIFGDGVNVAARLEQLADPGGVCISGAVYEQVSHKVDCTFDDLGHRKLRNMSEPVHIFRVRFDDTAPALANTLMFDVDKLQPDRSGLTTGGCLCGHVRYEINQPSIGAGLCHCRICQRSIGAAVNAWVAFPADAVRFAPDQPKVYSSSPIAERGFCPECGTSLTYRLLKPHDCGYLALPIATLDNPNDVAPTWHGGIESQMPWLDIKDDLPRTPCHVAPALQRAWASVGITDPDKWRP